jgi:hypothetical protein
MIKAFFTSLFLVGVTLAMSGCAEMQASWSGVNTATATSIKATQKNLQGSNDNIAQAWADSGCAIPYGEVVRNGSGNPNLPAAIITLCGAPSGFTMIHSTPTATATTTIPTNSTDAPAAPVPSSSAAPLSTTKNTAQTSVNALAAEIAALMQQH